MREAADSLVVTANNENEGFIEIWEVREKSQMLHKLFQSKLLEPFKTVVHINYNFLNQKVLNFCFKIICDKINFLISFLRFIYKK